MIYIPTHLTVAGYLPQLRRAVFNQYPDEFEVMSKLPKNGSDGWVLSWAFKDRPKHCAVIETGFWYQAMHIDMCGLYAKSSFNSPEALAEVYSYQPPKTAADIVLAGGFFHTKYRQSGEPIDWHGIVLPLQIPGDRSVRSVATSSKYWEFVEGACKKYGKNLLLKWHPMASETEWACAQFFANQYGSRLVRTDHSCLKHCKFVLLYNSTFAMDCFVRSIPVAQFAPGYWYETGAVTYTDGEYPGAVEDTVELGHKIANWCIWRYCFPYSFSAEKWIELLRHFSSSKDRWPLPENLSYAGNVDCISKEWVFNF